MHTCDLGSQSRLLKDSTTNCLLDSLASSYAECIDILYAQNTIRIHMDVIGLLPKMILPQRLSSITTVELKYLTYNFIENISDSHKYGRKYLVPEDLLTALPHLRKLYVSIEGILYRQHGNIIEIVERNVMVPMVNTLSKFNSHLQECNVSIHTGHMDARMLPRLMHFQWHWIRSGEHNIPLDDRNPPGIYDGSLILCCEK